MYRKSILILSRNIVSKFETVWSKYRRKCFEFRNDIRGKYLYRISIQYSIKLMILMNFDMFEIFDTICMSLVAALFKILLKIHLHRTGCRCHISLSSSFKKFSFHWILFLIDGQVHFSVGRKTAPSLTSAIKSTKVNFLVGNKEI